MRIEKGQEGYCIFFFNNFQCTEQEIWDCFVFLLQAEFGNFYFMYIFPGYSFRTLFRKNIPLLKSKQIPVTFQKRIGVLEKGNGYLYASQEGRNGQKGELAGRGTGLPGQSTDWKADQGKYFSVFRVFYYHRSGVRYLVNYTEN